MALNLQKPLLFVKNNYNLIIRTVTIGTNVSSEPASKFKSWREIPGPSSLPFIGPMLNFLPVVGSLGPVKDFYVLSEVLYKKYGPIVRLDGAFGSPPNILVYDAHLIEHVLRSENKLPERPGFESLEYFRRNNKKSTGLITEQGERWKTFRSAVNPVMLQPKTIKLYSEEIDQVALDMIARIKSIRDEKNLLTEDFEIELNKWALESVAVVALGGRLGCLDSNLDEDSPARKLIKNVRDTFKMSDKLDNKPGLWRYISTPNFKKAMQVYQEQIDLAKIFIYKAMEDLKKRDTLPEHKGVLEKLLEVDENVAVVMASDMLFAGVDTTAHTMLGTLYLLASNVDKQKKLREELKSTTPNERRPYLRACIKEALRLYPITGGNLRRATKNYNLGGYLIPEKMNIVVMHEVLSKMECNFPKSKEFLPERWVSKKDDDSYYGHAHPFAYSPFGFGVRMCIGRRIAELEIETFLSRLIENFEIEWFGLPPKRKSSPINYFVKPYNFIFKDIKKD